MTTETTPRASRTLPWMATFSGKPFTPMHPDPGSIDLPSIAHALSNICRFGGHCKRFYSVAQHSVLVKRQAAHLLEEAQRDDQSIVERLVDLGNIMRAALLHDAAEAYIGDVIQPIKPYVAVRSDTLRGDFGMLEACVLCAVHSALCVAWPVADRHAEIIHEADLILCATEGQQLMGGIYGDRECPAWDITKVVEPDPDLVIEPVGPEAAEQMFLEEAWKLGVKER